MQIAARPKNVTCDFFVVGKNLTFYVYDPNNNLVAMPGDDGNGAHHKYDVVYEDDPDPNLQGYRRCYHPWAPNNSHDTLSVRAMDDASKAFSKHQFKVSLVKEDGNIWHVRVDCIPIYGEGKKKRPYSTSCCIKCGNLEYCLTRGDCIMCGSFKYCC